MKTKDLQKHMAATYTNLRLGMAIIAFLFPVVLWVGALVLQNLSLRSSMSDYYHTDMRDIFVGVLIAIGLFLYLYKGFGDAENYALNFAGAFAIGVALFPAQYGCGGDCKKFTLHAVCAVLFFACITYVSVFRASDTLYLINNKAVEGWYRNIYRSLGTAMLLSPLAAVVLSLVFQYGTSENPTVFFVEAFGVWVFAAYWYVKTRELRRTSAEKLALDRALPEPPLDTQ